MKQKIFRGSFSSLSLVTTGLGLLLMMGSVNATTVTASQFSYTATIDIVNADTGTGIFTGAGVGATFDGTFNYGLTDTDIDITETFGNEASHGFFLYPSFISNGGTQVDSNSTWMDILDNLAITADDASLINSLVGSSLSAGDQVDGWGGFADTPDSEFDDITDEQTEGVAWGFTLASFSTLLYDNLDFRPVPPVPGDIDAAIFSLDEIRNGVTVYSVSGTISARNYDIGDVELTPVPVPAAVWLFGSAIGLLGWIRRRAA